MHSKQHMVVCSHTDLLLLHGLVHLWCSLLKTLRLKKKFWKPHFSRCSFLVQPFFYSGDQVFTESLVSGKSTIRLLLQLTTLGPITTLWLEILAKMCTLRRNKHMIIIRGLSVPCLLTISIYSIRFSAWINLALGGLTAKQ